jgi:hypothetical protein
LIFGRTGPRRSLHARRGGRGGRGAPGRPRPDAEEQAPAAAEGEGPDVELMAEEGAGDLVDVGMGDLDSGEA